MRVFVSYKKALHRQDGDQQVLQKNLEAEIFHHLLSAHGAYEMWVDVAGLAAGMAWETEIYRQVLASDVLVVLVGPATSESEWVRREIALAHAIGLSVVPIGYDLDETQLAEELKELSISHLQAVITRNIRLGRGEALLAELDGTLRTACAATRERQRATLDVLWRKRVSVPEKAADSQQAITFRLLPGNDQLALHVTSGDISRTRSIDVIVNSENDYMQMARSYSGDTVSSIIRRRGARIKAGRYQDTIQQELDWVLRDRGRPVHAAEAFATSAAVLTAN